MKEYAPIILFVYNRPTHTKIVVEALKQNTLACHSDLFVYADGPKVEANSEDRVRIANVRKYIREISGFRNIYVVEEEKNKGLDLSEINAISEVISEYGRAIIIEDDIVTLPFFLQFMNDALDYYENNNKVFAIGSFSPQIPYLHKIHEDMYGSYRTESWGWATWRNRWEKCNWQKEYFENTLLIKKTTILKIFKYNRGGGDLYDNLLSYINGDTDAWDARWQYCMYENKGVCIRPTRSLSYNIGLDGTGEHCGHVDNIEACGLMPNLYNSKKYVFKFIHKVKVSLRLQFSMRKYYAYDKTSLYKKIKRFIKSMINFEMYNV